MHNLTRAVRAQRPAVCVLCVCGFVLCARSEVYVCAEVDAGALDSNNVTERVYGNNYLRRCGALNAHESVVLIVCEMEQRRTCCSCERAL